MQAAKHAKRAEQALTSNQEGGAVWAELVPEGGEEVDELEDLATSFASCKRVPEAGGDQEQHKTCQKPYRHSHATEQIQQEILLNRCNVMHASMRQMHLWQLHGLHLLMHVHKHMQCGQLPRSVDAQI